MTFAQVFVSLKQGDKNEKTKFLDWAFGSFGMGYGPGNSRLREEAGEAGGGDAHGGA